MNSDQEVWQVEVKGQIYEADFDELVRWINESALLREDKVRRGNLRWLEAGRVPPLVKFFNAKELGDQSVFVSYTDSSVSEETQNVQTETESETPDFYQTHLPTDPIPLTSEDLIEESVPVNEPVFQTPTQQIVNPNACFIHPDVPPEFVCDACANLFCKPCPNSYGGNVKTCPMCGAMCRPLTQMREKEQQDRQFQNDLSEGFGFNDLVNAIAYPFRFKTSLIAGGIMFMFFSIGQSAGGLGLVMLFAAIFCIMMANALTFGVLANTVENFAQGNINRNFMPSFDDFDLWHDVIHPFFLSIGVYIVSFGLLLVLIFGVIWFAISSVTSTINQQSQATAQSAEEFNSPRQPQNPLLNNQTPADLEIAKNEHLLDDEEKEIQRINELINQHKKNQLESTIGPSPETQAAQKKELMNKFLGLAVPFLLLFLVAVVWGFFYFPVACIVAGYTRSFWATLNPLVGFDTIKRLGLDYFKILLMSVFLTVFSFIVSGVLHFIFRPFDLPGMGNLPAIAIGSLITFYLSVVFSVILGFAIYKNSDKFQMFRS